MHDPSTGLHSTILIAVDHPLHPLWLTGEIDVVDARLGDGGDEFRSVQRIRSDRRDDEVRVGAHLCETGCIVGVDHDLIDVGADPASVATFASLSALRPGDRPFQTGVGMPLDEVPGQDLADKARRSEQDDVVRP